MRLASQVIKELRGFIFDLDGTLIDSVDSHVSSWALAFNAVANVNVNHESLYPMIGLSGFEIMRRVLGDRASKELLSKVRWVKDRAFLKEIKEGRVTTYPGVIKLLKFLKKYGFSIGVASSTPNRLLIHILEYLRIIPYVDVITGGDEVSRGKPDPEIFTLTIRKLRLRASDVVIVGDTKYDVCPAHEIGAVPVLVNRCGNDIISKLPPNVSVYCMFHEFASDVISCLRKCY